MKRVRWDIVHVGISGTGWAYDTRVLTQVRLGELNQAHFVFVNRLSSFLYAAVGPLMIWKSY